MLEKTIDAPHVKYERGMVFRPRKWDTYINGERGPGQIKGKRDSVSLAEAIYPGSAYWYRSPIWRALSPAPMAEDECNALLATLDVDSLLVVSVIYFDLESESSCRHKHRRALVDELVNRGAFDALVAAVLLLRLAAAIHSRVLHALAREVAVRLRLKISNMPEVAPFADEVFNLVADYCRQCTVNPDGTLTDLKLLFSGNPDTVWDDVYEEPDTNSLLIESNPFDMMELDFYK